MLEPIYIQRLRRRCDIAPKSNQLFWCCIVTPSDCNVAAMSLGNHFVSHSGALSLDVNGLLLLPLPLYVIKSLWVIHTDCVRLRLPALDSYTSILYFQCEHVRIIQYKSFSSRESVSVSVNTLLCVLVMSFDGCR